MYAETATTAPTDHQTETDGDAPCDETGFSDRGCREFEADNIDMNTTPKQTRIMSARHLKRIS